MALEQRPQRNVCTKCGEAKLLTDFYADKRHTSGLRSDCKVCVKEAMKARRSTPEGKEKNRKACAAYGRSRAGKAAQRREDRKRYESEARKASRKAYNSSSKAKQARRTYARQNPEKMAAHKAVYLAVEEGRLIKPTACEDCGKVSKLHGHHYAGYTGTAILMVEWLCPRCHRVRHAEECLV